MGNKPLFNNKILIATGNKHKKEKLAWIAGNYFKKIEYPDELDIKLEVEEDGTTFEENAAKKAIEFSKYYMGYTMATDGGILIPSLGKKWDGLRTKRFAGRNVTDFDRMDKLIALMKEIPIGKRKMIWNEAIAIAKDGELIFSKQVKGIEGVLQDSYNTAKYKEGIWVCSVWFFPQFGKNFFDLTPEEVKFVEISWEKLKSSTQEFFDNYSK